MEQGNDMLIFLSGYFNHHQRELCDVLFDLWDGKFRFIATTVMGQHRRELGYSDGNEPAYVLHYDEQKPLCDRLICQARAVIVGSAPDRLMEKRLRQGKLTLRYSERFYKAGIFPTKALRDRAAAWLHHGRFRDRPLYMLCAGGFVAADCARFGNYRGRCYRWGYFPPLTHYPDTEALFEQKQVGSILWVGRMIDWKHPELCLALAEDLLARGYDFQMRLIGTGAMEKDLAEGIRRRGLADRVALSGAMPPEQVRRQMEQSAVFLATSDRNEGWGAVINEAMNSGCAVVAGHEIGAVPYLLRDGENALVYETGNLAALSKKVRLLLEKPALCRQLGERGMATVENLWNAAVAARRLTVLIAEIEEKGFCDAFSDGPCSRAPILDEKWYLP